MVRGMKSSPGICFVQDRALSWATTIVACAIVVQACRTKFERIRLVMTTSVRVWKLFLVMTISTCLHVWQGKRWESSLYTWASFSNAIVVMISRSISWDAMHSFLQRQHSKWILKSMMVWYDHTNIVKDV
jgi:hypothetical protein